MLTQGIPLIGDKKEQPQEMPFDPVPDDYIVCAVIGDSLRVYAEALSVIGPVVRFLGAYVSTDGGKRYSKARNLMCFYTGVRWSAAPAPAWWANRAELQEGLPR